MRQTRAAAKAKGSKTSALPPKSPTPKKGVRKTTVGSGKKAPPESKVDLEYSSDEAEDYSDTEPEVLPTTPAKSVSGNSSVGSSRSKYQQLPLNIEKQLLIDIESNGSLLLFDTGKIQGLRTLLDNREDVYGKYGDPVRKKILQRVKYFKSNPETYQKRLLSFEILPAQLTQKQIREIKVRGDSIASPPAKRVSIPTEAAYVSDLEDESISSAKKTPSKKTSKKVVPPTVTSFTSYRDPIAEEDSADEDIMVKNNAGKKFTLWKFNALFTVAYSHHSMLTLIPILLVLDPQLTTSMTWTWTNPGRSRECVSTGLRASAMKGASMT